MWPSALDPILVHSENGSDVLPRDMKAEEVCEGVIETETFGLDPVFDLKRQVGRWLPNIRSTVGKGGGLVCSAEASITSEHPAFKDGWCMSPHP